MLFGIAGGLGDYLNIDPTIIRLLFVAFTLLGGPGLIVYIIMALIVPEEPVGGPVSTSTGYQAPPPPPPAEEPPADLS